MRAWRHWLLLIFGTSGLAACLLMVQVLAARLDWRLDLTPEREYTLSEHAREVLRRLDKDVQITAFLRADDERNRDVSDLLERVTKAAPRVQARVLDLNRNPAVARQYGVINYTGFVVESGGRRRDFANPNETLLIAAILDVTRQAARPVFALSGHGEVKLDSTDRQTGYSNALTALTNELYEVRPLDLGHAAAVPDDAALVVIGAPQRDLLPSELAALDAYVARGGALLVLLEPGGPASLTAWLRQYGVMAGDGIVVDAETRLFAGDLLTVSVPERSPKHPVTAGLAAPPLFSSARVVRMNPAARSGIRGIELLRTAPSSWEAPDVVAARQAKGAADATAVHTPLPVGVSLMVGGATAAPGPIGRLVVLGDADFASNFFLEYLGNKDLWVNSVNWLAGEMSMFGSRPESRLPGINQFFLTAEQGWTIFWLGTLAEPGAILGVGLAVWAWRRWRA